MEVAAIIWCGVLTLALGAHMIRDARESQRVSRLEEELRKVRGS